MQEPRNDAQRTEQSKLSPSSRAGWPRRCIINQTSPSSSRAVFCRPCAPLRRRSVQCRGVPRPAAADCAAGQLGVQAGRQTPSVQFKLNFLGRPRLFALAHVTQILPLLFMKTAHLKLVATPVLSECPRPDSLMGLRRFKGFKLGGV